MLKILYKINYLLTLAFILSLLMIPAISMAQANKAELGGSFITGDLCGFWTDARWQQEFSSMKADGMNYIVIQAIVNSYPGQITETLYPSSLPNTEMATGGNGVTYPDIVDACLRNAESAGMKVFIGLDLNNNWWNVYANDTVWLYSQMVLDNKVCDEVWSLYKSKYPDAFFGWYWAYEVDNVNFSTQTQQHVLTNAMNMQLDHLITVNEKLPFMWCPFMNSSLGTPQSYQTMWENVLSGLHTAAGDIFCPQDCIGAGGLTLSNLESWFSALRQAVNTKKGLVMWSDVETFEVYENNYLSATIGRVVSQLKIEEPYVDNYVSWEYCYYDSPYNADTGYQATYKEYFNTGSLETSPPTTPKNFTAVLQPDADITLNWNASTDSIGVCGYYLYRNGKLITMNQAAVSNGGAVNNTSLTNYTDEGLSSNTNYIYQVTAFDFAGNVSSPATSDTVKTDNFNVVSHNCKYTFSVKPSSNYPDPSGKKLTDGIFATTAYYADPAWVGFLSPDTLNVVIDLGQVMPVQQFLGEYLLDPQPAVFLPTQVNVSLSSDKVTFTNLENLIVNGANDTSENKFTYYYTLPNPVNARYVKFSTIAPNDAWIFVDEYEVLAPVTTGIKNQSSKVTAKYGLSQNYPNPFNPGTNINFSVERPSNVTLAVYNILGQKVATLVNSFMQAGSYIYQFDASKLASGVYFYRIEAGNFLSVKKMILMK
jgi:hypothetical protein